MTNHSDPEVTAVVVATLPQRLYRLETEDAQVIIAGPSQALKRLGIAFKPGQTVLARRTKFDPGRGIIVAQCGAIKPAETDEAPRAHASVSHGHHE